MSSPNCPTIQRDFLAARASLLEVAAFLDRIDRAGESDYRHEALHNAMEIILKAPHNRAAAALEHFSDMSQNITEQAASPYPTGTIAPCKEVQP